MLSGHLNEWCVPSNKSKLCLLCGAKLICHDSWATVCMWKQRKGNRTVEAEVTRGADYNILFFFFWENWKSIQRALIKNNDWLTECHVAAVDVGIVSMAMCLRSEPARIGNEPEVKVHTQKHFTSQIWQWVRSHRSLAPCSFLHPCVRLSSGASSVHRVDVSCSTRIFFLLLLLLLLRFHSVLRTANFFHCICMCQLWMSE